MDSTAKISQPTEFPLPQSNEVAPSPPDNSLSPSVKSSKKYLFPVAGVLALLIIFSGAIFFFSRKFIRSSVGSPEESSTTTPSPTLAQDLEAQAIPTPFLPTVTPKPQKKVPTLTPTSTPDTGTVLLNFNLLHTDEPIEGFEVEIYQRDSFDIFKKIQGQGNSIEIGSLPAGDYRIMVRFGEVSSLALCGVGGDEKAGTFEITVQRGQKTTKTVNVYPYPGFLYVKTEDWYPLANAQVELTNEGGTNTYYSTQTDVLGRAVVYTINPNPHWLRIRKGNLTFSKKLESNTCLWIEKLFVPFSVSRSDVKVNYTINADYLSLMTDLVIEDVPLNILSNAVNSNFNYDDIRKYTFTSTQCPGLFGFTFKSKSLNSYDQTTSVLLENVALGTYKVCAYEIGNPGVYYASTHPEVTVDGTPLKEVGLIYPAPQ